MGIIDAILARNQSIAYTNSQRIAYTERVTESILSKRDITLAVSEEFGGMGMFYSNMAIGVVQDYNPYAIVEWNGVIYKCQVNCYDNYSWAFGNESISGSGEDTGEPFIVMQMAEVNNGYFFIATKEPCTAIISIDFESDSIHRIPSKYIPEIKTVVLISPNGTNFKLTVDDSGNLGVDNLSDGEVTA